MRTFSNCPHIFGLQSAFQLNIIGRLQDLRVWECGNAEKTRSSGGIRAKHLLLDVVFLVLCASGETKNSAIGADNVIRID